MLALPFRDLICQFVGWAPEDNRLKKRKETWRGGYARMCMTIAVAFGSLLQFQC